MRTKRATLLLVGVLAVESCRTRVSECGANFPEWTERIAKDFAPWQLSGITPEMIAERFAQMVGNSEIVDISIQNGELRTYRWGQGYRARAAKAEKMLRDVGTAICNLSDTRFLYHTSDHAPKTRNESAAPSIAGPSIAPMAMWCKRETDFLTVLGPETMSTQTTSDHGKWRRRRGRRRRLQMVGENHTTEHIDIPSWENRTDKLWFRGNMNVPSRARVRDLSRIRTPACIQAQNCYGDYLSIDGEFVTAEQCSSKCVAEIM